MVKLHGGFDVRGVTSAEAMYMNSLGDVLGCPCGSCFEEQ